MYFRQAQELTERTSADQAAAIKEPLAVVNGRWDELLRGVVERQRQLENALLRLGQFQHALAELLVWIDKTDGTLAELKPQAGDPQALEVELAKLKVGFIAKCRYAICVEIFINLYSTFLNEFLLNNLLSKIFM